MGFSKRNSSSKSKKNGGSGGGGRKTPKKDDSNKNMGTSSRPSDLRRERLRKNCDFIQTTTLNNLVPIQRYFSIAVRLFEKAKKAYNESDDLDKIYVLCKRFSFFSHDLLPTHNYYNSTSKEIWKLRSQNMKQTQIVLEILEYVVDMMDHEELETQKEIQRKKEELHEMARQELVKRLTNLERRADNNNNDSSSSKKKSLASATESSKSKAQGKKDREEELAIRTIEKLKLFAEKKKKARQKENKSKQQSLPKTNKSDERTFKNKSQSKKKIIREDSNPMADIGKEALLRETEDIIDNNNSFLDIPSLENVTVLPPPSTKSEKPPILEESLSITPDVETIYCPPPTAPLSLPPPLYNDIFDVSPPQQQFEDKIQSPSSPEDNLIPILDLIEICRAEFQNLEEVSRVQINKLKTYQGRLASPDPSSKDKKKDSTNGCAVISPLVAISHLKQRSDKRFSVSDEEIERIIDEKAPPILCDVRSRLGLPENALIIPSDVHDFLVDKKMLTQEMFVGVCGGNLLNPKHVDKLLFMLEFGIPEEESQSNKKESNDDNDIDNSNGVSNHEKGKTSSNNKKDTKRKVAATLFFHEHVVSIIKIQEGKGSKEPSYDLIDSMPGSLSDTKNNKSMKGATRTRCKDIMTLEVTLRWYACSKFTSQNRSYIDSNVWDDALCDFDPRVFQAFVWTEAS